MKPTTITQYGVYYSYSNVPFDNCDADWHLWTRAFDTLEEALSDIAAEKEDDAELGAEFRYKIVERSVTLTMVYEEAE